MKNLVCHKISSGGSVLGAICWFPFERKVGSERERELGRPEGIQSPRNAFFQLRCWQLLP